MDWKKVSDREWARRLQAARDAAASYVAAHGLDLSGASEPSIAGLVLEDGIGISLVPSMRLEQTELDAHIKALGDPVLTLSGEDSHDHLSERVFGYAMSIAEAAFLFGVIAGCQLPWSVVSKMPAPSVPVKAGTR